MPVMGKSIDGIFNMPSDAMKEIKVQPPNEVCLQKFLPVKSSNKVKSTTSEYPLAIVE